MPLYSRIFYLATEFRQIVRNCLTLSLGIVLSLSGTGLAAQELNFEYFKNEVQPVFLAKREGNVRCIQCHTRSSNFRLQPLEEGRLFWTDEQSRANFESASQFAVAGSARSATGSSRIHWRLQPVAMRSTAVAPIFTAPSIPSGA